MSNQIQFDQQIAAGLEGVFKKEKGIDPLPSVVRIQNP